MLVRKYPMTQQKAFFYRFGTLAPSPLSALLARGPYIMGKGKNQRQMAKKTVILAAVWTPSVKGVTFLFWTYFQAQLQGTTLKMRAPSSLTVLRRRLHTIATSK